MDQDPYAVKSSLTDAVTCVELDPDVEIQLRKLQHFVIWAILTPSVIAMLCGLPFGEFNELLTFRVPGYWTLGVLGILFLDLVVTLFVLKTVTKRRLEKLSSTGFRHVSSTVRQQALFPVFKEVRLLILYSAGGPLYACTFAFGKEMNWVLCVLLLVSCGLHVANFPTRPRMAYWMGEVGAEK